MRRYTLIDLFSLATCLALIFSLFLVATVQADDTTPPTPEETALPPTEQPEAEAATVTELLSDIPDNTDLVVVVDGEAAPLVSEAVSEAILVGDPIWCPAGAAPDPNNNGCTDSYPDLESLIADIDNSIIPEPDQDGTIWIMSGTDTSASDVVIDGSVFTTWGSHALTLQGGWDGSLAGTVSGTSSFSVPLSVVNWGNNVSLAQLTVDNAATTGLEVDTVGDIALQDITASNNDGNGAELHSTTGTITLSGANVFSGNTDDGLYAETDNSIQIENITASDNGGYGVELYTPSDVTLTGTNTFTENNGSGVYVEAGDITAENLTATDNNYYGAELYSTGNIALTGNNIFNNNGKSGIYLEANQEILTENVTASNNDGNGAELYAGGDITVAGVNEFAGNRYAGILVVAGGSLEAANITAGGNDGNGAEVYALGNFLLNGLNVFTNNYYSGLYVEAGNDTLISNITAIGNGVSGYGSGVELYTAGQVLVDGFNFFSNNEMDGMSISADGDISVQNLNSHDNGWSGIYLQTNGNAAITCGILSNNDGYEVETDLAGTLTLTGVDFGGDIENEISVDENNLFLVSNGCFTYPTTTGPHSPGASLMVPIDMLPSEPELPINQVQGSHVNLDCDQYQGTLITLDNGDGAYIPCPITDTAELVALPAGNLPHELATGYGFVSSFLLTILKDNEALGPLEIPNSIWYVSSEPEIDVQVTYWNGMQWIDATSRITPFMDIFFRIPDELKGQNLAILYWDGGQWLEITDSHHLGNGYIVKNGGRVSEDGLYFEATMNFTGTFVLVKK